MTVVGTLGTSTPSNLPTATHRSKWVLDSANPSQTGWVRLNASDPVAAGSGYAFKSLVAPSGGRLSIDGTATMPIETSDDCPSDAGCAVVTLSPTQTASIGNKLIGNPFAHNVDWSRVRIRVGSQVYTPSEAQTAEILSKQIWLWNGASYDTWDDVTDPGNLRYFRAFFIRVLSSGRGEQIELLIPAEISTLPLSVLPPSGSERLADANRGDRGWAQALLDWLIPSAAASEPVAGDWQVRLRVENPKTGANTRVLLGQKHTAEDGYDESDLVTMTPFASPYLTLLIPQRQWGERNGYYASDFRPADGAPTRWTLELHMSPVGTPARLRWRSASV